MRDGTLERILRKWGVWNADQPPSTRACSRASRSHRLRASTPGRSAAAMSRLEATRRYLPSLLRASAITIILSCLAMALAVGVGMLIATGRVYGARPLRLLLTSYVELVRGTPILLQLFVLYYGIAAAIRLPAFAAALLGLALNYAAYESEIYRAALEAVSIGQIEAARTLGLSETQVLRLVRAPQAFRLALAPMTNDFVALLKDSSLVSVLTVLELTKQTQIFATNLEAGSSREPCARRCIWPCRCRSRPLRAAWSSDGGWRQRDAQQDRCCGWTTCASNAGSERFSNNISLEVAPRELVAIMGPSGSGKTTVLRAVAGLEPFSRGRIVVGGVALESGGRTPAAALRGLRREVGMVFQFHCLFEHISAHRECLPRASARARDQHRGGAAPRTRTACRVRCRPQSRRVPARAVGRRSPARRDRARARR